MSVAATCTWAVPNTAPLSTSPDSSTPFQCNLESAGVQKPRPPFPCKLIQHRVAARSEGMLERSADWWDGHGKRKTCRRGSQQCCHVPGHLQPWALAVPPQHCQHHGEQNQMLLPMALPPALWVQGLAAAYFQGGLALGRRKCGAEYSNDLANIQNGT